MNSKIYSLSIDANFSDVDKVIYCLNDIFDLEEEALDDISLALFEILANAIEHGICQYSKDEIFSSSLKTSHQKIDLYFWNDPKPTFLINYIKTPGDKNISQIGQGKKIVKYLNCNYSYHIASENVFEVGFFTHTKKENQ